MRPINFDRNTWLSRLDEGDCREDLLRIAAALGQFVQETQPESTIYVGYDTRAVSVELADDFAALIASYDLVVKLSETHCPVPALCGAVRKDPEAFAGIILTAGSRPFDYAGLRIYAGDGSAPTSADMDELEEYIVPEVSPARGSVTKVDVITPYLETIGAFFSGEAIAQKEPLIVCDSMYGPTASYGPRLLGGLGAKTIEIHGEPDETQGSLHPEAAEPWIDDCEQMVLESGAALGVCFDGAGERMALIDDKGRYVTPHLMLAIIMEYLVEARGITGRMVAPIFLSSVVKRQAERLGMTLTITPAGYMWMREEMLAGDVVCAGDALGGIGIPSVALERDPLSAAAALVDAIMLDGRKLSDIVDELDDEIGHMEYGMRNVRMGSGDIQTLRNIMPGINPQQVAEKTPAKVIHAADSLRLEFDDDSWVLIRPSRTSSIARIYAEASTPAQRDELLSAGEAIALNPFASAQE